MRVSKSMLRSNSTREHMWSVRSKNEFKDIRPMRGKTRAAMIKHLSGSCQNERGNNKGTITDKGHAHPLRRRQR